MQIVNKMAQKGIHVSSTEVMTVDSSGTPLKQDKPTQS